MQHEAIYALYKNAERISGNGADAVVLDASGNVLSWDASAVATKEAELLAEFKLGELREERNLLLAETDHWFLSDTADATSAQTTYRQALRDITDNATSLDDVSWPEKP
tara:strand:- start:45 stop:371 length:327 start_codon:yes stop_codon:yes gene_type:complete